MFFIKESTDSKDQLQIADDNSTDLSVAGVLTLKELRHIFQQQLEHQKQETLAAVAEVKLLTTKLEAETSARIDAQVCNVPLRHGRILRHYGEH